jgi:hypothetical protein
MANNEQRDFPMADGMFPPPSARNDLVIDAVYRRALTARLDRLSGVQRRIAQPLIDPVVAAIAAACPTILAPTRFGMRLAPVPHCGPEPAFWLIAATSGAVVRAEVPALPVTAGVSPAGGCVGYAGVSPGPGWGGLSGADVSRVSLPSLHAGSGGDVWSGGRGFGRGHCTAGIAGESADALYRPWDDLILLPTAPRLWQDRAWYVLSLNS